MPLPSVQTAAPAPTSSAPFEVRSIELDEFPAFVRVSNAAFGERSPDDELADIRQGFEFDRSVAAFDAGRMVGTASAYSFDLTLPGSTTLPAAGVSWVGVLPTDRRRGVLRAMMRYQLERTRERGEALAILTASESSIYGRFGYGLATTTQTLEIDTRHAGFRHPLEDTGQLRLVDHETGARLLQDLYDNVRRAQPGAISRSAERWASILAKPNQSMGSMSPRFFLTYTAHGGELEGLAVYRIEQRWSDGFSSGTLVLRDLLALTREAYASLWRFCLDADLITAVRADLRPLDEPVRWMLSDPRRLRTVGTRDELWLRVLDVSAALAARRYETEGTLTLEIIDSFPGIAAGRYTLDGGPEGATCRPTTASPDLTLDAADLGAIYLGGVRPSTLARAGRVAEGTPRGLARADALFGCWPAPYCATTF